MPSGWRMRRSIGLSLLCGLALAATAEAQYRATRPVRGAWLRPPSSLGALETQLQGMARAGLTDLYLETLYWGVSTGGPGVFNARYGINYLAQSIPIAAKYNIRLHAWCESAYWQYQSTGAYNFAGANAGLQALNISTGAGGGDGTAGQVFANLCHPDVQAKMRAYFAELAAYTGLWGIQSDYHRFPLDNDLGDAYPSPWSYDAWSRSAFQAQFGADPLTSARFPGDPQYNNFLTWRKAGITQAANQMKQGIDGVNTSIDFSIAMFANPEVAKCQDWRAMATAGYVETLVPMVYNSSAVAMTTDLNTVRSNAAGRRVVAGLYVDSTVGHPTIAQQLTATQNASVQDWIFFSAGTFQNTTNQSTVRTYITGTAQKQRGDFNNDGYVDARDRVLFDSIYSGTPVNVTGANARYNFNGDSIINFADLDLFEAEFARAVFGEDGIVNQRDLDAMLACFGQTTPSGYPALHLYDLNGDAVVNYQDQLVLHSMLTVALPPDTDVNADGRTDIEDLYRLNQSLTRDVNRDGLISTADIHALDSAIQMLQR